MKKFALLLLATLAATGCREAAPVAATDHPAVLDAQVSPASSSGLADADTAAASPAAALRPADLALPAFDDTPLPATLMRFAAYTGEYEPAAQLPARERWIGTIQIVPARSDAGSPNASPYLDSAITAADFPITGGSGLVRHEVFRLQLKPDHSSSYFKHDLLLVEPGGNSAYLAIREFGDSGDRLPVYGREGDRYDISPVAGFPLWIDASDGAGALAINFLSISDEIASAPFIAPLFDQPALIHAAPDAGSQVLKEVYREDTDMVTFDGYVIAPRYETSADGDWVKVTLHDYDDYWCGGTERTPSIDGWMRWRDTDGAPRIEWRNAYSC